MLLSTFFFVLLVSDFTIGSIIVTKKVLPLLYKSRARVVKTLSYSFKNQAEQTPSLIKSNIENTEYNVNFVDPELFTNTNSLFSLEVFLFRVIIFSSFYYYYQYLKIDKKNDEYYKLGLITWDYLAGLIETDGSFKISLDKKGKYKPIISISQKENTELLDKIKTFLNTYQINSTLDISNPKKSNRAPQLRIQGSLQVLQFCNLLEKEVFNFCFCSQKYRDLLIVKTALSNLNCNFKIKIDLILNLHKTSLDQPDLNIYKTKINRDKHEQRLGLTKNASHKAANFLLKEIDKKFNDYKKKIEVSIFNKTQIFNNDWCVGIMDGDGCFSISIEFIETDTNKRKINFVPSFQLVMESDAKLTIEMFKFMVNCEGRLIEHKNQNKEVTAIYYRINRIDELKKILYFFKINNTRNIVKKEQLNLINTFFKIKEENNLENYEVICNFIKQCYKVTELGKGKGKRKYTLLEALEKTKDWLN